MICLWNNPNNPISYFSSKNNMGFCKKRFENRIIFLDNLVLVFPDHIHSDEEFSKSPMMFWI